MEEGFPVKCGIRNATLKDVTIGDHCLIENVSGYIANYDIKDSVMICNAGVITTQGNPNFALGNVLSVLNEAGDGNVVLYENLTAQTAQLMMDNKAVFDMILNEQKQKPKPERGVIGAGCRITGTKEIYNVIIGESAEINGASKSRRPPFKAATRLRPSSDTTSSSRTPSQHAAPISPTGRKSATRSSVRPSMWAKATHRRQH